MTDDSRTGFLSTLLRRGASPFHTATRSMSAARPAPAHTPEVPSDQSPGDEKFSSTFASPLEISLEESTSASRHESEQGQNVALQSRPEPRSVPDSIRREPQLHAPPQAANAENDSASHCSDVRLKRGLAPAQHVAHQFRAAHPSDAESFETPSPLETAQQFKSASQISSPRESSLKEIFRTGTRAEHLAELSNKRTERLEKRFNEAPFAHPANFFASKEVRPAGVEGEPQMSQPSAELTLKVERIESANANLNAARVKAHALPQVNHSPPASAAFVSESAHVEELRRAQSVTAQGKTATLTIKRLEVQIINQTPPAPQPPAPQANARQTATRTNRAQSLHRHYLGRFGLGI
jgi:hypothetical protein